MGPFIAFFNKGRRELSLLLFFHGLVILWWGSVYVVDFPLAGCFICCIVMLLGPPPTRLGGYVAYLGAQVMRQAQYTA